MTPPDRPQGRGRKLTPPPTAEAAQELGIELLQAEDVNDEAVRERIAAARPSAVVVCAFGQLIREPLLSAHLMLNVHPSLLPRWRGAAPIERAIMAGDTPHRRLRDEARRRARRRAGRAPRRGADRGRRGLRGALLDPGRGSAASCWSARSTSRPRAGSSSPSRTRRR